MIRWVESTPVDRTLIGTGKTLVYVGIVTGLYLLWSMSQPRAGFFGVGARGVGTTQGRPSDVGLRRALPRGPGIPLPGIGRAIQELEAMRSPQVPAAAPIDSDCNGSCPLLGLDGRVHPAQDAGPTPASDAACGGRSHRRAHAVLDRASAFARTAGMPRSAALGANRPMAESGPLCWPLR